MFRLFSFAANIAKCWVTYICFGSDRGGWNHHCFALTGLSQPMGMWLYAALRPECEAGLEKFWKHQSKNISFLFMYISHFVSYWELFISFIVSKYKTWPWNTKVSGSYSKEKRKWNELVIRQTNFILCSLKSKHFLSFFHL